MKKTKTNIWNAKLTYIQIFVPRFKYLDLGTTYLYLSSNHDSKIGINHLKIGIDHLFLGKNDLYLGIWT